MNHSHEEILDYVLECLAYMEEKHKSRITIKKLTETYKKPFEERKINDNRLLHILNLLAIDSLIVYSEGYVRITHKGIDHDGYLNIKKKTENERKWLIGYKAAVLLVSFFSVVIGINSCEQQKTIKYQKSVIDSLKMLLLPNKSPKTHNIRPSGTVIDSNTTEKQKLNNGT